MRDGPLKKLLSDAVYYLRSVPEVARPDTLIGRLDDAIADDELTQQVWNDGFSAGFDAARAVLHRHRKALEDAQRFIQIDVATEIDTLTSADLVLADHISTIPAEEA